MLKIKKQGSFIKPISIVLTLLSSFHFSVAQQKFTISGTVKDKATGESLIGATIKVTSNKQYNLKSNEYGFYSITLPKDSYSLKASFVSYNESDTTINLDNNITINIFLDNKTVLQEVVISTKKKNDNLTKAVMGTETLNMKDIAKLPILFGEKDVLKTIQLLPGVKSAGEGNAGFSVRGGTTDQNLILLDEAPVYNASHLLGFFSTFNSDAIKDATLIKGNAPTQYGGRLASVLDVKMKEGNNKNFNVNGGIGLISSRLSVEGPIQKDKSSFIVSGRRTYADVFLKASPNFKDNELYFYDLNAKANYQINKKNRLFISGYFGKDLLSFGGNFGIDWGNQTATLRLNTIINSKLFLNTSFIHSNYDFGIKIKSGETDFNIRSNIRDWNLKQDYTWYANPKNAIRFGFQAIHHTITPNTFTGTVNNSFPKRGRESLENAIYINNNFKANDKLTIDYGVRAGAFTILGGDTYKLYDKGKLYDSVVLAKGKIGKTYWNLEPRLTANYRINEMSSIKFGYARNVQHLHLLSNSTAGNPSDQWIGNSYNIKPEIADQISVGYSKNFNNNNYELNIEGYYKNMQNQVDYKDGADLRSSIDLESQLLFGVGRAYGVEIIFKKKTGKLNGWISYTLSKTERKIDGINNGNWYNARLDRTHDLSIVATYQINEKWTLSGLFVFNTGNAVTYPTGKYEIGGQTVFQYANRNANRMPSNHRLDLSATVQFKQRKKWSSDLSFGVYNIYGQQNPFTITFRDDPNDKSKTQALQTALFRWVPSISYNFRFN